MINDVEAFCKISSQFLKSFISLILLLRLDYIFRSIQNVLYLTVI